jgi:hypothetical protein
MQVTNVSGEGVDRSISQFNDVIVRFDRGDTAWPLNVTVC